MDIAEERARNSLPPGEFDSLKQVVRDALIMKELALLQAEQDLEEQRITLIESEKRRERLENEEAVRIAYKERQDRGLALSREQLRASGMVERIGQSQSVERPRIVRAEQGCIQLSSEFPANEPQPISLLQGANLHGFRRETIDALIPQMQEIRDNARAHRDVMRGATGYMMFHIWTGGTKRAGTRAIALSDSDLEGDVDELYDALQVLLDDIEKVKAGYSYIYEGTERSFVHFFFRASYYPRPRDVSNWGKDIEEIEKRECFNIFTAAKKVIPCTVQVAKRLWGSDAKETTIEEIIKRASPKLCIVKPRTGIKKLSEIKDFSDFVLELNSPYKKLSVIDPSMVYLLHYNEHIGILEDIREQKRKQIVTTFRPVMKYANCKKVTMCFDIECYFDVNKDQNHIPYVCCACFIYDVEENGIIVSKIGNVMEFEGRDCVAQMLDYAVDNVDDFGLGDIELIAHNGGGYDFHYILTSVADPSIIKNPLIRNNNFITFKFEHCNVKFTVKDSYNFLACSLQKAVETFLGEKDRK